MLLVNYFSVIRVLLLKLYFCRFRVLSFVFSYFLKGGAFRPFYSAVIGSAISLVLILFSVAFISSAVFFRVGLDVFFFFFFFFFLVIFRPVYQVIFFIIFYNIGVAVYCYADVSA